GRYGPEQVSLANDTTTRMRGTTAAAPALMESELARRTRPTTVYLRPDFFDFLVAFFLAAFLPFPFFFVFFDFGLPIGWTGGFSPRSGPGSGSTRSLNGISWSVRIVIFLN